MLPWTCGGSAYFTTADYLRLDDGVQFTALPGAQDALLSISPVAAFGFLGTNPGGGISVDGSILSVEEGQTLSLVGGDITIGSSSLNAPGGKVVVASVASPGEVLADTFASAPNVNGESFTTMGKIILSEGATLDVSGDPAGRDAAGTVIIRGGQLMMTNATISADTVNTPHNPTAIDISVTGNMSITSDAHAAMTAKTTGAGDAGEVRIEAGTLETFSNLPFDDVKMIGMAMIDTHTSGSGKGGNVNISVQDLRVNGNALAPDLFILTGTEGPGAGGDVTITTGIGSFVNTIIDAGVSTLSGFGSGGNLTLKANRLTLDSVGFGTDSFTEKGGNITLQAADLEIINGTNITTFSLRGDNAVLIQADRFVLTEGSSILSATAGGPGNGVTITGSVVELHNGSAVTSQTFGDGNAGPIRVNASDHVSFTDDPKSTFPGGVFTSSFGDQGLGEKGNAGAVEITTPRLEISGGARITTETQSGGRGGDVTITATEKVSLIGGRDFEIPGEVFGSGRASGIYTRTLGSDFCGGGPCGAAGNISITTGSFNVADGAVLDSGTTNTGHGGTISVNAGNHISIAGILEDGLSDDGTLDKGGPGGVFSRTIGNGPDSGNGGSISLTLTADGSFFLKDGASVLSSSDGPGNAGAINIDSTAGSVTIAQGAVVDSGTTSTGAGGAITIHALDNIAISGTLDGTPTGVLSQTTGSGSGGTISLRGDQSVTLSDGVQVSANSDGPGNAGAINIDSTAGSVTIAQGAVVNSGTTSTGAGGTISLRADQNFTLSDGATVSASSSGFANAGNITLGAIDTILIDKATVTTEIDKLPPGTPGAAVALGGNIKLTAGNLIQLTDSEVNSRVQEGSGSAGSINLDPDFIVLKNSKVLSTADVGDGGPITLIANSAILIDSFSELNADSRLGGDGAIDIRAPVQFLSGTIVPLPQNPAPVTALYGTRCVAGEGGHFSTFVDSKADSLAPPPGTFLASPFLPLSNASNAVALSYADKRGDSEPAHATPIQVAAYSPPILFGHSDEMLTACP